MPALIRYYAALLLRSGLDLLAKVKELHDKQEFGQFTAAPPKVFTIHR